MNIEYWSQLGTNSKSRLIFSDTGAAALDGIKVSSVLVNAYISLIKISSTNLNLKCIRSLQLINSIWCVILLRSGVFLILLSFVYLMWSLTREQYDSKYHDSLISLRLFTNRCHAMYPRPQSLSSLMRLIFLVSGGLLLVCSLNWHPTMSPVHMTWPWGKQSKGHVYCNRGHTKATHARNVHVSFFAIVRRRDSNWPPVQLVAPPPSPPSQLFIGRLVNDLRNLIGNYDQ